LDAEPFADVGLDCADADHSDRAAATVAAAIRAAVAARGIAAAVVAGLAFGAMHADMQGSVGIVRVVSTTCLGLACGAARLVAGTVFAPMVVHFVYNAVSLALGRGLFRGDSEPLVSVVPNRLLAFAAALALGGLAVIVARRARRVTPIE